MKKIFLALLALIPLEIIQAQPEAGKVFIGGNLGFTGIGEKDKIDGTITDEQRYSSFRLLPKAGYFLSSRLAVGVQTGISTENYLYPDNNPDRISTTLFVLEPFGRYYLTGGAAGVFTEASMGLAAGKSKTYLSSGTTETNETSLSIYAGPGVYYYLTPWMSLEAQFALLGYSANFEKTGDVRTVRNQFNFEIFPAGIVFGISFFFR